MCNDIAGGEMDDFCFNYIASPLKNEFLIFVIYLHQVIKGELGLNSLISFDDGTIDAVGKH